MSKIKVTYILSNIDKAIAFEWIAEKLNDQKFELSFILMNERTPYLFNWLKDRNTECYFIAHKGKKSYLNSFLRTLSILKKIKPAAVHTHLMDANLIGLSAAKLCGIKKRISTRHHSTFHHVYFPKAVKWDRLTNYLSTKIVAISRNVENVLTEKENVSAEKISFIYHGFDLQKFVFVDAEKLSDMRSKYGLNTTDFPVVGVISRYVKLKGIQYTVIAFKKLIVQYPKARLVIANALGPDKEYITSVLRKELNPENYVEIQFEPDLFVLYRLFDVYVHVPINRHAEAFGQTYVEALAAGIPSVFTLSGVASEFIRDNENALVVNYEDSNDIFAALSRLLSDYELRNRIVANGKRSVGIFDVVPFVQKLEKLYE